MKKNVIIVAGGSGMRMGADIPKQFLLLKGKAILMHTIDLFYKYDPAINIVLVLPKSQIDYWKNLCASQNYNIKHRIVEGGETRFYSVKNGLNHVEEGFVAIHDGVRPMLSIDLIDKLFNTAIEKGNAIPAVGINESLRIFDENSNKTIDRQSIKIVQTPQVFRVDEIKMSYTQAYKSEFTDDASVLESMDYEINLVEGDKKNIKITTSFDLLLVEALINKV